LIIDNIPAMTFQGRYTFCITHVEAMVEVINTKEHLQDPSLNPFYTFIDNNRKIQLHNTEISGMTPDNVLVIGDCQVQKSFEYYANVTTRLRLSFVAFTTLPIACGDTSPIWFALNEPTEQSITQLRNEVTALEDEVEQLRLKNAQQDTEITNLKGQVELNRQNISDLVARVTRLESNDVTQDLDIQRLKERVAILEAKDPALVSYKANKELRQAQLTWKGYGQLYQVSQTYYATGDFENDVRLGYLIPVAADAQDVSALAERVEEVATIATDAGSTATAAAETVDGMATTVSELSETVTGLGNNVNTISGDVETLSGTVTTLGETVTTQGTAIGENTTAIGANTTAITGLNETVVALNNDIDSLSDGIETAQGNITSLDERVTALEAGG
jgi:peptidoglycan hydrolase CwlO-like protein